MSAAPRPPARPAGPRPGGWTRRRPPGRRPAAAAAASSSRVAHGCSAYSRPNRPARRSMRAAWSDAPRRRWRPPGSGRPGRARPGPPPPGRCPRAAGWPRSATFTFAVRQPDPATMRVRLLRPDRGHRHVDRHLRPGPARASRSWRPPAHWPASGHISRGPYSANGENSPHPAGPSISAPSRTVMPRNRVRIGIANARSARQQLRRSQLAAHGRSADGRTAHAARFTGAGGTWRSPGCRFSSNASRPSWASSLM